MVVGFLPSFFGINFMCLSFRKGSERSNLSRPNCQAPSTYYDGFPQHIGIHSLWKFGLGMPNKSRDELMLWKFPTQNWKRCKLKSLCHVRPGWTTYTFGMYDRSLEKLLYLNWPLHCHRPEQSKAILQICAECTKADVALNNLVIRSRTLQHENNPHIQLITFWSQVYSLQYCYIPTWLTTPHWTLWAQDSESNTVQTPIDQTPIDYWCEAF